VLAAAAAGCGGSSSSSQSTAAASSSGSAGGATTGAITKPGAALTAGQTATVHFTTTLLSGKNGPTYKLQVEVESIKQGSLSDLSGLQLNASEKQGTPTYVKLKLTNLGPGSLNSEGADSAIGLQGVDDTGQQEESLGIIGDFAPCPDVDTPSQLAVGKSFQTCDTFLVPGGIKKIAYIGTGSDAYGTSPITWTG
jgi:hypothetical protein